MGNRFVQFMNAHALHSRKVHAHLKYQRAELANAQFALEAAIRRVEQDAAIETAVHRMEQDLIPTDTRPIVREEDVSHAAPGFISRVKQFIRDRVRSRE